MKKYRKKSNKKGKLLQIRLSEEEYKMVVGFINKFNVTHREWILTSVNELWNYNIIRGGSFWYSDSDFAHANADRYDKKITKDSVCEECGRGYYTDNRGHSLLQRHHYLGYKGDNAFKVKILCQSCHAKKPKNIDKLAIKNKKEYE